MITLYYVQMSKGPVVDRTAEFAKLRRQLDVADADIPLENKRLDEAQGMCFFWIVSKYLEEHDASIYNMLWLQMELLPWRPFGQNLP